LLHANAVKGVDLAANAIYGEAIMVHDVTPSVYSSCVMSCVGDER